MLIIERRWRRRDRQHKSYNCRERDDQSGTWRTVLKPGLWAGCVCWACFWQLRLKGQVSTSCPHPISPLIVVFRTRSCCFWSTCCLSHTSSLLAYTIIHRFLINQMCFVSTFIRLALRVRKAGFNSAIWLVLSLQILLQISAVSTPIQYIPMKAGSFPDHVVYPIILMDSCVTNQITRES